MEVELVHSRTGKTLARLDNVELSSTIADIKREYQYLRNDLYPSRQSYRTEPKGKALKDDVTMREIGITNGSKLFFKDLGPQVGWTTVFLTEYAGPLVIYLIFYSRPAIIYGAEAAGQPKAEVVNIACACWSFHYAKRLLETIFVHRFSHATMPIMNIFKNSVYYWGFASFIAYFMNHPQYTPPTLFGDMQVYGGLAAFTFCQLGNLSIHLALRNLRPEGSKERKIPYPTSNPFTLLFNFVSCPNYTYEIGSWLSFSVMTQCLPALIFTVVGFAQMAQWAMGKHVNYKKEFKDYPRNRKPILPFLL